MNRQQKGFALITSVMVGAILVIIVAVGGTYLLGSSNLGMQERGADRALNAAKSCLAYAVANFDTGNPDAVATTSMPFDQTSCDVMVAETPDDGYVIISDGRVPGTDEKKRLRAVIKPDSEKIASYAILAGGDVSLQKHSFVASLPTTGKGDVHSNGDVSLLKHSSIWGVVNAAGDVDLDAKSHVWGGYTEGAKTVKIPAYTDSQITGFADEARAVKSQLIGSATLPAGALQGYYYSYADYDILSPQDNGATLTLSERNYTLDGTMFVAGKLVIDKNVTVTGEGRIIATEGIVFRKHAKLLGTSPTSHTDLVSLYGDIEVRHHAILGQVSSGLKGRKDDEDDGNDTDDEDCKFGLDDVLWADKRDIDRECRAGSPSGGDQEGQDKGKGDDKDKGKSDGDKDKSKDKDKRSLLPGQPSWLTLFAPTLADALFPPAFARDGDDDEDEDGRGKDKDDDRGNKNKKKSGDSKYHKLWKKKYRGVIPVGCTVYAMSGNVKFSKHVSLFGNVIAKGNVELHNHTDIFRNSDDPVQSVGIFAWQTTSVQRID